MAQYIDKDRVVAEIEKLKDEANPYPSDFDCGRLSICKELMDFLDTIGVKDVDLKKEIKDYFDNQPIVTRNQGVNYQLIPSGEEIAKHFFELGLRAQKGE